MGVSPFQLMFGQQSKSSNFEHQLAFDVSSYQDHLQAKLAELRDLVFFLYHTKFITMEVTL